MAILNVKTVEAGLVGVTPKIVYIETDDSSTTVLSSTYLNDAKSAGYSFSGDEMALVKTTDGTAFYEVAVSGANAGLEAAINPGNVTLPVVDDYIAVFDGTTGKIKDAASPAINPGNIQAGLSGTVGAFSSYPATASKGLFQFKAQENTANHIVSLRNAEHGQATVYQIPDVGSATGSILDCALALADPNINMVAFDVTVGQAALASGGSVTLQASSGSKQYKIRELYLNGGGTNFSGGGGDRLATISDSTTDYSVIPAATMQSLANARWGDTGLPFPASAAINVSTAAGAALTIAYSGGASDYTAGELVLSGVLERVA